MRVGCYLEAHLEVGLVCWPQYRLQVPSLRQQVPLQGATGLHPTCLERVANAMRSAFFAACACETLWTRTGPDISRQHP